MTNQAENASEKPLASAEGDLVMLSADTAVLEGSYFADFGCRALAIDALIDSVKVLAFARDPHDRDAELDWLQGHSQGALSSTVCFEWIVSSVRDVEAARFSFMSRLERDPEGLLRALKFARAHPDAVGTDLDSAEADNPFSVHESVPHEVPRQRAGAH